MSGWRNKDIRDAFGRERGKIKRRKPSSTSKLQPPAPWRSNSSSKKQQRSKPLGTLWASKRDATSALMAPASEMASLKKYKTAFLEIGQEGDQGDTKCGL